MKLLVAAAIAALALGASSIASASAWRPGAPIFVSTPEVEQSLMEDYTIGHAGCLGIKQLGHRSTGPNWDDEEYRVFECNLERVKMKGKSVSCVESRWKTVKAKKKDFWVLRMVSIGECF